MKEFRSKNSGRYIFNEDIHNLQELALSQTELFKDSGLDFVISGCNITVTENNGIYTIAVTSGYVFLANRIRKVAAFSGTTTNINTIGIYETEPVAPQITYLNGDTDYMYNDYEAEVKINFDNSGNLACVLATYSNSHYVFPNLRTAYFAHYALINDGTPGHYPLIEADKMIATVGEFANLKINNTNIADLFVPKSGGTMNDNASLTFTKQGSSTVITGNSITVGGQLSADGLAIDGNAAIDGNITADTIIKNGGTSTQFLKADGSVDGTEYATTEDLEGYLPLTGGTLTGDLTVSGDLAISKSVIVTKDVSIQRDLSISGLTTTQAINGTEIVLSGDLQAVNITLSGDMQSITAHIGDTNITGALSVTGSVTADSTIVAQGSITANSFIKSGGTATQFLKADGSVDSTAYATSAALGDLSSAMEGYLPLSGGTLTGDLTCQTKVTSNAFFIPNKTGFIKADGTVDDSSYLKISTNGTVSGNITANSFIKLNGTSAQFLKADGSVDNNTYVTTAQLESAIAGIDTGDYLSADGGTIYNGDHYINLQGSGIVIGHLEGQATLALTPIDRNLGISARALEINCATTISGSITATSFVKSGGTSSQFLKADGSVDSNTYVTNSALSNYLSSDGGTMYSGDHYVTIGGGGITIGHLEGMAKFYLTSVDRYLGIQAGRVDIQCNTVVNGSITATSLVKSGGTSSQFLKADGSVDNNTYATASSLSGYVTQSTLNSTLSGYAHSSDLNGYMPLDDGGTIYSGDHYVTIRGNGVTIGHLEGSTTLSVTAIDRELGINNNVVVSGTVTATSFPTSSDERLKTKISDVLLTAEQIANAPAINFKYKGGDQSIHAGTIAQYWQEILPAVIMGKSDRLTMDYGPAAMVAVINLAKEVVALKNKIAELKGQTN